jgi:hydroxypyruvate reductase
MLRSASELRSDVEAIWRTGVEAVLPERLIRSHVQVDGQWLLIGDETIDVRTIKRIAIVGAGKAAGAMAVALENVLGPRLLAEKNVAGWLNVPANCIVPSQRVHLHAARPATVNEPRPEGVEGTRRILEIISALGQDDLCFCLFTGGGSALMPAPVPSISLDDKVQLARLLAAAGANIEQINVVRRQLSLVKGGGLARACRAGQLVTLLISDVLGDSLEAIASGPTVPSSTTAADALDVLDDLDVMSEPALAAIVRYLTQHRRGSIEKTRSYSRVSHHILGNNATAVDAAGLTAEGLGYSHAMISATKPEGSAEEVGRHLAEMALRMRRGSGPDCLISGGEPTVTLVNEAHRGKGGRNQQLALAALATLGESDRIAFLSAGTDGEDGPTDAAGAAITHDVVRAARSQKLDPQNYLARNDAYHFFQQAGGLFITGPTQTNVCDLRVIAVDRESAAP